MSDYVVDLTRNTVNGKRVLPQVAELTYVLVKAGGVMPTDDLILKIYGLAEPQDALCRIRGVAYQARKAGIPIWGEDGRGGRWHLSAAPPIKTNCKRGHALTPDNIYQWTSAKGHVQRHCLRCRRRNSLAASMQRAARLEAARP